MYIHYTGIKSRDVISLVTHNTVDFIVSFLAITNMGAIVQPLNSQYKREEFESYLADTMPKMIILDSTCIGNYGIIEASIALKIPLYTYFCGKPGDEASFSVHLSSIRRLKRTEHASVKIVVETDIALYLHTSGTTSQPKGVPLSHKNLVSSIMNISKTYDLTENDRTIIIMPLFHVHGLVAALLTTFATGCRFIVLCKPYATFFFRVFSYISKLQFNFDGCIVTINRRIRCFT